MSGFVSYANTALLSKEIQHWAASELPAASHPPHYVEVSNYRFRVRLSTDDRLLRVRVDDVPLWRMTARQLCDAVWRVLRAYIAPAACRAAKLREDKIREEIVTGVPATVPGLAYADGKWWTVASVCQRWQSLLSGLLECGNGKAPREGMSVAPDFAGLRIDPAGFEAVIKPIESLIVKRDWPGVTWADIEPILLLLYSIPSKHNGQDVTRLRDRMFVQLFQTAAERLGFGLDAAQRLTAAMDHFPLEAHPRTAVLKTARPLWFAAAHLAALSFLPECDDGVALRRIDKRFYEMAKLPPSANKHEFAFLRARDLMALGARLLQSAGEERDHVATGDARYIARLLKGIVASPLWSEEQRQQLVLAYPADAEVTAQQSGEPASCGGRIRPSPRRWGVPPSMSKDPIAASGMAGSASL